MKLLGLCVSCAIIAIVLILLLWNWNYSRSLVPRRVATIPLTSCSDLTFDSQGVALGPAVERRLPSFDSIRYFAFAIKGREAVRFKPREFHGTYGDLVSEPSNKEYVHIYVSDKKNLQMLVN
jgi:hypothetical protein